MSGAMELKLTPKQQEIVDFSGEHMLIKGVPGSGKTLVLLRKCRKLLESEPNVRIGFFTYNSVLARYAIELMAPLDSTDRLNVNTFHSWASKPLKDMGLLSRETMGDSEQRKAYLIPVLQNLPSIEHKYITQSAYLQFLLDEMEWMKEKGFVTLDQYLAAARTGRGQDEQVREYERSLVFAIFLLYEKCIADAGIMEYADYALRLLLNHNNIPDRHKFDYVMVDEAQDLSQVQLQVLRMIAGKGLVIAADHGQKIYKTDFSWQELGIKVRGRRTKVLQNSFRSTKQIMALALSLQKSDPLYMEKGEDYIEAVIPDIEGPEPILWEMDNNLHEEIAVVSLVQELLKANERQTIGVLTRKNNLHWRLKNLLYDAGISSEILYDKNSKILTPGVKLSTFHSAKGLEFDAVIILRMNDGAVPFNWERGDVDAVNRTRRLTYVAMTRAKYQLHIFFYKKPSQFLKELDAHLYKKMKIG